MASHGLALVVDDDEAMRKLVADLLAWEGIVTRELPSGEGLVEIVEREDVGLVVLDKEMPGASGLDLVAYLRCRCPHVPVIVITAFGGPWVRAEAIARGAAIYLDKPFRVGEFLRAVREALRIGAAGTGTGQTPPDPMNDLRACAAAQDDHVQRPSQDPHVPR